MTEPKKKPGVAFWTTIIIVGAIVGYPLSLGPACWITSHLNMPSKAFDTFYRPIVKWLPYYGLVEPYSHFGAADGWTWWSAGRNGEVYWSIPRMAPLRPPY